MNFQTYQGREGLERLAPTWTALAESIPGARFSHFPGWYRAYMTSRKSDPQSVWFVAAYCENNELCAVFPLQFQSRQVKYLRPRQQGQASGVH